MPVLQRIEVIRAILDHLGIWLVRSRPPLKIHDPPVYIHKTDKSAAPHIMDEHQGHLHSQKGPLCFWPYLLNQ